MQINRTRECCDPWQNQFIHHNILTIGHTAWNGYTTAGKGMVLCDVIDVIHPAMDWRLNTVTFNQTFIPQAQIVPYLQSLDIAQATVAALLSPISTYNPTSAIVLLLRGNHTVEITLLQNLAISPADCYAQVQRRWTEFQPPSTQSQAT